MNNGTRHNFTRWSEFQKAVDEAAKRQPLPSRQYMAHTKLYEDINGVFSDLTADTSPSRRPINGDIASELGALVKEITLSSILTHTPEEPYFAVAHILRDALRQRGLIPTVSVSDDRWLDAIQIALAYSERDGALRRAVSRSKAAHITFAHAIRFFITKGIDIRLSGDQVIVGSPGAWSALAATVASPLSALGDAIAMRYMDAWLSSRFDASVGRLHLHPTPDTMGQKVTRSLPYGHLYRTAIKALGRERCHSRRLATPTSMEESAKHFAALYEVEPFSIYEVIFPPYPARISEALAKVALYDELFAIPQCDPSHMDRLIKVLFDGTAGAERTQALGWSLSEAIELWRLLLSLAPFGAASCFIKRSQLKLLLSRRIGHSACNALLAAFALENPNRRYCLPSDATHADTRECAVAEASGDRYWIAPGLFLGPAFFARLVSRYAEGDTAISGKIGLAFEGHMLRRMRELGIQCRSAEVIGSKGAKAGDIDLVVETNDVVALFELKKKGLTRKTNAGDNFQLLVDLARGVVHGANQLARHELTLLRTGELKFADGSGLRLDERRIVKCVISLADYGGFHDGATLRNMFQSFCQITLGSNVALTEEQKECLEEVNKEFKTLQTRHNEFMSLQPSGTPASPFDNLLFHNVFFVEYLLLSAPTAEQLLETLLRGNRMVTGSRDPFFEHAWFHSNNQTTASETSAT